LMASSQRSIGEPCAFLPNRPGEPYFQLRLVPDRIVFRGERLSEVATTVEMQMINLTQHRQCFKIKCTSVEIFRVRPPLGFLNGGETIPIRITFFSKQVPQTGKHFFVFYHIATNEVRVMH
uniref:Major sperm protein n=1 Tax=Anisakis simplex TaxID=6269 RepID=A0A0M3IZM0_ANISI